MDAAALRHALGPPERIERVGSPVSGASYERWVYPDREVVLLDGLVLDAVP
ncbi:MAG TPA: hypothetical protein VMG32_05235 [Anaeromyxobacteraceae bacterium]|nr:hypothetical protein [Anaeromyxobacteraceae bacterium]